MLKKMTQKLLSKVRDIMGTCDTLDNPLDRTLSVDGDSFILKNLQNGKSILIGEAYIIPKKEGGHKHILAFKINSKKWKWAESEGFTRDEIIDIFANEIFEELHIDDATDYLTS